MTHGHHIHRAHEQAHSMSAIGKHLWHQLSDAITGSGPLTTPSLILLGAVLFVIVYVVFYGGAGAGVVKATSPGVRGSSSKTTTGDYEVLGIQFAFWVAVALGVAWIVHSLAVQMLAVHIGG